MSNLAVETLLKRRQEIETERMKVWEELGEQRREIDLAVEQLTGKPVFDIIKEEKFDDENPNYIKGSFEEH